MTNKNPHKLFIGVLLLIVSSIGIGYMIGKNANQTKINPQLLTQIPSTSPSPQINQNINNNIITQTSESIYQLFAGNAPILKYNNWIYFPTNSPYHEKAIKQFNELRTIQDYTYTIPDKAIETIARNTDQSWVPILQAAPIGQDKGHRDIFGLQQWDTPLFDYIFITEWDYANGYYEIYIHKPDYKLEKIAVFPMKDLGNNNFIPRLKDNKNSKSVSDDGKFIAFDLFTCWYCEPGHPDTMLFNVETKAKKLIGKVSYFNWKKNGEYEFRDYIVQPCPKVTPTECSADPQTLPLKTGSFD